MKMKNFVKNFVKHVVNHLVKTYTQKIMRIIVKNLKVKMK